MSGRHSRPDQPSNQDQLRGELPVSERAVSERAVSKHAGPARDVIEYDYPGWTQDQDSERAFLDVRDLAVHFQTEDGLVRSVDGISFQVERGRTLGIVGESGSGKSVTSLSLLGLHKRPDRRGRGGARLSGEIWLDGEELVAASPEKLQALRGNKMAMIFQDPLSAMHPYYTVGTQIAEAYLVHNKVSKAVARKRAIEMLDRVGIPQPSSRVDDYPHQFSGGMRQRAMIAMSLVCNPQLLIADEPTTALDVTVQAQILDLMRDLQREFNSALIVITHDLGVVAELADDIMVMYGGKAVEYGPARTVFNSPEHPYTWGLLSSMPRLDRAVQDRLLPIPGNPPSMINVPTGCAFHPRCTFADLTGGRSSGEVPELADATRNHLVRCHLRPEQRRRLFAEQIAPHL
jgi:peptide/nickel transport system ATP-binding protein